MSAQERREFELEHIIVGNAVVDARRRVDPYTWLGKLLGQKSKTLFDAHQEIDISVEHAGANGGWTQRMTVVSDIDEALCGLEVELGETLDLALRVGPHGDLTAGYCSQQIAKGLRLF